MAKYGWPPLKHSSDKCLGLAKYIFVEKMKDIVMVSNFLLEENSKLFSSFKILVECNIFLGVGTP